MSYNTRRGVNTPNNSMAGIGQRRPMQNNFTSGGQLTPQKQPVITPSQQQQQTGINFRNTPGQQQQQQKVQQQQTPQQQQPKVQQQQTPQKTPAQLKQEQPLAQNPENPAFAGDDTEEITPKKFWAQRKGIKISKKEKQRRRNVRLSKILQPKNAVMILNELCKNPVFTVTDVSEQGKPTFQSSVTIDGVEHVGMGNGKNQAKNSAAENAIKYLIKHKRIAAMCEAAAEGADGNTTDEKMEVDDGQADQDAPLPWQHVASFALFKLFTAWGEDTRLVSGGGGGPEGAPEKVEHRPSKSMPAEPEKMQPLMLLNQMMPHAHFEELPKTGAPPNLMFNFQCKVDDKIFQGSGSSKKIAKKMAAFAACHKILNVSYPPDVWSPII